MNDKTWKINNRKPVTTCCPSSFVVFLIVHVQHLFSDERSLALRKLENYLSSKSGNLVVSQKYTDFSMFSSVWVPCFAGVFALHSFTAASSVRSFSGTFPCVLLSEFLPCTLSRYFFRVLFRGGFFLCAFLPTSSPCAFPRGLFPCAPSQKRFRALLHGVFFCALCRKGIFRALFTRGFFSGLFCKGFLSVLPRRCFSCAFFSVKFFMRSTTGMFFACSFARLFPCTCSKKLFYTHFRWVSVVCENKTPQDFFHRLW